MSWAAVSPGIHFDYAQLTKLFGDYGQYGNERYSLSPIAEVISKVRQGDPDPEHISTSYVERQNLTMRVQLRRLTRLTNAFSKKLENLKAAVALHFAWYNFREDSQEFEGDSSDARRDNKSRLVFV